MRRNIWKYALSAVSMSIAFTTTAFAQAPADCLDLNSAELGEFTPNLPVVVVVDQERHLTHLYQMKEGQLLDVLAIKNSTGKPSTPTPNCKTKITAKILDPIWTPPKSIDKLQRQVPPFSKTHANPLGTAFLRLNIDSGMIALHGTNSPKQIGKFVSHGCVRHLNDDILKVNKMVSLGTPVCIVQNLESAQLHPADFYPMIEPEHHNIVASHHEAHSTIPLN